MPFDPDTDGDVCEPVYTDEGLDAMYEQAEEDFQTMLNESDDDD